MNFEIIIPLQPGEGLISHGSIQFSSSNVVVFAVGLETMNNHNNNNNNNNNNNTDAPSYRSRSPETVLRGAEVEKKKKYTAACLARRASFTPLCCSVDGMLGTEANFFLRRLADQLSSKWEKPYSSVMGWVQARLSFTILRATMICVRGSRVKWRSLGIIDGAPIFETV